MALLTNDLRNICSKVSEIRLLLLMAYTINMKELDKVEKMGG